MKILVTGANGQLGSELKTLSANYPRFVFDFTDLAELDITDKTACANYLRTCSPDAVINCAAYTAVDKAETDREKAHLLNVEAVENLTKASEQAGAYFIHISTDYVFDGKTYMPYVESDATCPQSEYGRSKELGEKVALQYEKSMIVRTAWLYSSFGNNFVKTMIRLGSERRELNVVFDQTGTPTYAGDLASALLQIIDKIAKGEKPFVAGIYHYSNEGVCSWYDFACSVMELKGLECKVNPIETKAYPTPAQRPPFSVLNKAKIKATYGIEINRWETSLKKMIREMGR
jgi:dTDP-4-dehydrorhamnose reductase